MSEAQSAERPSPVTELKVTGHLMTLEPGLFCIVQSPGPVGPSGLPGVRLSLPPGPAGRPEQVSISGFRDDGWLGGHGDAALVRVSGKAAAQVLVTVYQAPGAREPAPALQVLRLLEPAVAAQRAAAPAAVARPAAPPAAPQRMDIVAHIAGAGDVGARLTDWVGERGSKRWIEGFAISPVSGIDPVDIEYQAVLGRGWLSPWVEGGQFCGSRGMALPILGLNVRLRGGAAERFDCMVTATFVDGSAVGPVAAGESCEAESLAPVEAFQVMVHPRGVPRPVPGELPVSVPVEAPPAPRPRPASAGAAKPPGAKPKPVAKAAARTKPASAAGPKRR